MSERLSSAHQIIPTSEWSSPQRREYFETNLGMSLGTYAYRFDASHYGHMLGAEVVGEGVAKAMTKDYSEPEDTAFRVTYYVNRDSAEGEGFLFFGASSREFAERFQPQFTQRMNRALEYLDAGFRLDEPED